MNNLTRKFKELLYSIKTDDHYSEYNEEDENVADKFKLKEFNLTKKFNSLSDLSSRVNESNGSSISTLNRSASATATGNDELNLSDDEQSYHHNPKTLYAHNDLEYSSENIHMSHLGEHRYRNSSNDIDEDDDHTNDNDGYNDLHRKEAPYEESIDDGSKEVILAWEYIKGWCAENSSDLYASLNDPCSSKDLKEIEKDLQLTLPKPFKISLRIHDGQELDGLSGVHGLIYGLNLMTLDEVVSMQENWSKIYHNLYNLKKGLDRLPKQGSIPPNHIKPLYCNPRWVPVITDNAGNNIAIDLDPGFKGSLGQVIVFGRDFDTKFVVAENWGQFLANFVRDLKSGNWDLGEDEDNDFLKGDGELLFIDSVNNSRVFEDYLNVLKRRVWSSWKKQRDIETLATNKPRFNSSNTNMSTQSTQPPLTVSKNVARGFSEVERRVESVRDFSIPNGDTVDKNVVQEKFSPKIKEPKEEVANKLNEGEAKEHAVEETKEEEPVEETKEEAPVEEEPVEETKEEAPVEETPVEETKEEEPSIEEAKKEEPVEETPVEETKEEEPVEEAKEEEPIEEPSVEEAKKEEPVEETPVEEIKKENVKEETPIEETNDEIFGDDANEETPVEGFEKDVPVKGLNEETADEISL
ncbi:hypothetical protein QEN19_004435 [Hanseniaspora menglaensis]